MAPTKCRRAHAVPADARGACRQEFFYPQLKPWYHYVPVKSDLSDLDTLVSYFLEHDDAAREIARNGYQFIISHLRPQDVTNYWRKLLTTYAQLQSWKTTAPANGAVRVTHTRKAS